MKKTAFNKELVAQLKKLSPQEKAELLQASTKSSDMGSLRSRLRQTHGGGRKPVEKVCPHCKLPMPARDFWKHEAECYAIHNPDSPRRRGRPEGWRKGDGAYAEFKPTS